MTPPPSRLHRAAGWCVHLYTALGLVCGLYTLFAIVDGRPNDAFLWMTIAIVIDGSDGIFARAAKVKEVVPEYDGRKLDDITDYLNYVFLPVYFAARFKLIPGGWEPVLALPLLASAYGFCSSGAKTSDGYFTGFPSTWNVVVFYQFVLGMPPVWAALVLAFLSVMVFVPIRYLHPTQSPHYRRLSIALTVAWMLAVLLMLRDVEHVPRWLACGSLAYPAYYVGLSFYLHFIRDPVASDPGRPRSGASPDPSRAPSATSNAPPPFPP
ncbi:MAG: hypothetical protein HY815_11690 [Candidatus Riflebacteria bacterium]|nr:hypothetical protein [Candidatus Riflebacteria bacterium]